MQRRGKRIWLMTNYIPTTVLSFALSFADGIFQDTSVCQNPPNIAFQVRLINELIKVIFSHLPDIFYLTFKNMMSVFLSCYTEHVN